MKDLDMRALISAFLLGAALFFTAPVLAEEPPLADRSAEDAAEDAAEERATQFVGVRGAEAESVPGGALMLGAYAIVWVLLFLFLLRLRSLQRQTAEELERLSAEINATEGR